jgi:hypothetical protein
MRLDSDFFVPPPSYTHKVPAFKTKSVAEVDEKVRASCEGIISTCYTPFDISDIISLQFPGFLLYDFLF